MKLLLSKSGYFEGDVCYNPKTKEITGLIQVGETTLDAGNLSTLVSIVGTVTIEEFIGGPPQIQGTCRGVVESLFDLSLPVGKCPTKIQVSGRVNLGSGRNNAIVGFKGTLHPTSYLCEAWTSLLNPNWVGDRNF